MDLLDTIFGECVYGLMHIEYVSREREKITFFLKLNLVAIFGCH